MKLYHRQYNLYGWMKAAQESRVNIKKINQGVVHINVSEPNDFKMSEEDKILHVLGVVLIQQLSLKSGLKNFVKGGGADKKK